MASPSPGCLELGWGFEWMSKEKCKEVGRERGRQDGEVTTAWLNPTICRASEKGNTKTTPPCKPDYQKLWQTPRKLETVGEGL